MARSDLVLSAYRYLMNSGVVAQLLSEPGMLGPGSLVDNVYTTGWVFRSEVDGLPFVDVENSGHCAITIYSYDDWSASPRNHSIVFPRLHIAIFADPDRDTSKANPIKRNAKQKVERIHELIHPLFHDSGNRLSRNKTGELDTNTGTLGRFDDLIIISSVAGGGLSVGPTLNGDGMMRGDQVYDLSIM